MSAFDSGVLGASIGRNRGRGATVKRNPNLTNYLRDLKYLKKMKRATNPFEKEQIMKAEARQRAAEAKKMGCVLNPEPDPSIINMINSLFKYFGLTGLSPAEKNEVITALNITEHAVLINSCHGGLPVTRTQDDNSPPNYNYDYETFFARSKIRRLIKSPNSCCSYILPNVRRDYFSSVIQIISDLTTKGSDTKTIIKTITKKLIKLSFDLPVEQNPCRTISGSESICVNRARAFEYVETNTGEPVINKIFATDEYRRGDETNSKHKLAPRGMLFCNNVTITVNNSWFPGVNPYNAIIANQFRGYEIGDYQRNTSSIRYTTGTNLLSCPHFMWFAMKRLGPNIIGLNNSLSLSLVNDQTTLIQMITRVTAEVLYWYFLNQPFFFIDMSCESLCYRDADGRALETFEQRRILRSEGYEDQLKNLQNRVPIQTTDSLGVIKTIRRRGGNRKTRYKTKKYKKRGNIKTKKYRKRNMSQKQG